MLFLLRLLSHFERLGEFKSQIGLSRKHDIFVSGESGATGARTGASRRTDSCTLATSGESANNAPKGGAATGQNRSALPFAFF